MTNPEIEGRELITMFAAEFEAELAATREEAVLAEREACAKLVEDDGPKCWQNSKYSMCRDIASRIRRRQALSDHLQESASVER